MKALKIIFIIICLFTYITIFANNLYSERINHKSNHTICISKLIHYINSDYKKLQEKISYINLSSNTDKFIIPKNISSSDSIFTSLTNKLNFLNQNLSLATDIIKLKPLKYLDYIPSIFPYEKGSISIVKHDNLKLTFLNKTSKKVVSPVSGTITDICYDKEKLSYIVSIKTVLGYIVTISNISDISIKKGEKVTKYQKIGDVDFQPLSYSIHLGNKKLNPLPYTVLNSGFVVEYELKILKENINHSQASFTPISFNTNDYHTFIQDSRLLKNLVLHLSEIKDILNIKENLNTIIDRNFYDQFSPSEKYIIRINFVMKLLYQNINNYSMLINTIRQHLEAIPNKLPLQGGGISRGFTSYHTGIDIYNKRGIPVCSAADGIVSRCGYHRQKGNYVEIDHAFGFSSRYYHFYKIKTHKNAKVKKGDVIGTVGSTGRSTGNHLHYEVRTNNKPIDPLYFMNLEKLLE